MNGGSSFVLSSGKSAIICSPTYLLNLWQVMHFDISLFTTEFPCITQYLEDLISVSVIFLLLCTVFSWHHLLIKFVICSSFSNKIGCLTACSRRDCFSCPATLALVGLSNLPHLGRGSNIQCFLLAFLIDLPFHWGFCVLL